MWWVFFFFVLNCELRTCAAEMSRGTKRTNPGAWQTVPSHCHHSMFQWAQRGLGTAACRIPFLPITPDACWAWSCYAGRPFQMVRSHEPLPLDRNASLLCCTQLCILHTQPLAINLCRQLRNGCLLISPSESTCAP